jgi:hypothetical protein
MPAHSTEKTNYYRLCVCVFPSFLVLVLVVEDLGVVAPPAAVLDRLQSPRRRQLLAAERWRWRWQ